MDNGMTAFNGAALNYDANGNLTSDGTKVTENPLRAIRSRKSFTNQT